MGVLALAGLRQPEGGGEDRRQRPERQRQFPVAEELLQRRGSAGGERCAQAQGHGVDPGHHPGLAREVAFDDARQEHADDADAGAGQDAAGEQAEHREQAAQDDAAGQAEEDQQHAALGADTPGQARRERRETNPRQSTGAVVSGPAAAAEKAGIVAHLVEQGARLDSAGRRFSATSTRPSRSSQGRSGGAGGAGSSSTSASISSSSGGWPGCAPGRAIQGVSHGSVPGSDQQCAVGRGGSVRVSAFYGIEQLLVQLEAGLGPLWVGHGAFQRGPDDLREVAVEFAEHRIVGGIDHPLVEADVVLDVVLQVGAAVALARSVEMFAQCAQVAVVAANGCQARRLDLESSRVPPGSAAPRCAPAPAWFPADRRRRARRCRRPGGLPARRRRSAPAPLRARCCGSCRAARRVPAPAAGAGRAANGRRRCAGGSAPGRCPPGALEGNGHGRNIQSSDEFARRIHRQLQARKASLGEKRWPGGETHDAAPPGRRCDQPTAAVSPARREMPSCARRRSQGLGR